MVKPITVTNCKMHLVILRVTQVATELPPRNLDPIINS